MNVIHMLFMCNIYKFASLFQVVRQFRDGGFNTLVSTCVGEEGLDIGDVDLIICYDAHKSPIRYFCSLK